MTRAPLILPRTPVQTLKRSASLPAAARPDMPLRLRSGKEVQANAANDACVPGGNAGI